MTPNAEIKIVLTCVHQWTTWGNEQKYTSKTVPLLTLLIYFIYKKTKHQNNYHWLPSKGLFLINMCIVPITKIFHYAQIIIVSKWSCVDFFFKIMFLECWEIFISHALLFFCIIVIICIWKFWATGSIEDVLYWSWSHYLGNKLCQRNYFKVICHSEERFWVTDQPMYVRFNFTYRLMGIYFRNINI